MVVLFCFLQKVQSDIPFANFLPDETTFCLASITCGQAFE